MPQYPIAAIIMRTSEEEYEQPTLFDEQAVMRVWYDEMNEAVGLALLLRHGFFFLLVFESVRLIRTYVSFSLVFSVISLW